MRSGEAPATSAAGRGQFAEHPPPRLTKSRTSLELNNNSSRAANKLSVVQQVPITATTVTPIPTQQQPVNEATPSPVNGQFTLQRSKSSGSHLTLQQQKVPVAAPTSVTSPSVTVSKTNDSELPDVTAFPDAAQTILRKIAVGRC